MLLISPKDYTSMVAKQEVHNYSDARDELYTQLFWMQISCGDKSYLNWMIIIIPSPFGRGFIHLRRDMCIKVALAIKSFAICFNEEGFWKNGNTQTLGKMKLWLHGSEKHLSQEESNI